MDSPIAVRTQHRARPGRRTIVATDLSSLRGPVRGAMTLPLRLFWSPAGQPFDLDKPFMLRLMYETVLQEAACPEELTSYLNGDMLIAVWPELFLPRGVRQAWEERHSVLRGAVAVT